MTKSKYLTNQALLKELEKRLADFTDDELTLLLILIGKYQSEMMKIIKESNPQVHGWIQEKYQQLQQEKTDKKIEKIKKTLEKK